MALKTSLRLVLLVVGVLCLGACGGDDESGACAVGWACGDDYSEAGCDLLNGTFYPGQSCPH